LEGQAGTRYHVLQQQQQHQQRLRRWQTNQEIAKAVVALGQAKAFMCDVAMAARQGNAGVQQ